MHYLFYMMGKSASGKDTLYKRLLTMLPQLSPLVLHTTRPQRAGEQEGREYHFISEAQLAAMCKADMFIEVRTYHTKHGDWTYCTAKESTDLSAGSFLGIGTLESYEKIRAYYGKEKVIPIYIEVEDGLRLQRALERERAQETPHYAEMCRRFLTDSQDFSEEKLAEAGIGRRFANLELDTCAAEIAGYISDMLA